MPDREKVVKVLTDALTAKENYPWAKAEISFEFIEMLLSLLKEQGEEIENLKQTCQSMMEGVCLLKEQEERIKLLEHQLETLTRWRMNAGAFD